MLSEDRKFYDLCRKYKYYYKSYQEVAKLKDIYWSKYIQEAYNEVSKDLKDVENEIIFLIFDKLFDEKYVQINKVMNNYAVDVEVRGEAFIEKLKEYIEIKHGMSTNRFWGDVELDCYEM